MIYDVDIPGLIGELASRVNNVFSTRATDRFTVYFDYGRYNEITRRLTEKGNGQTVKSKRFPLIWLVIPYTETVSENETMIRVTDLQIIIATQTKPDSTTPKRMSENFKTRLLPIYEELIRQIEISGFFSDLGYQVPHRKINQPYWDGKENGPQQANMFNDFIDAVQIKNLDLTINEPACEQFAA